MEEKPPFWPFSVQIFLSKSFSVIGIIAVHFHFWFQLRTAAFHAFLENSRRLSEKLIVQRLVLIFTIIVMPVPCFV